MLAAFALVVGVLPALVFGVDRLGRTIAFSWSWDWWLGAYVVVGAIAGATSAIGLLGSFRRHALHLLADPFRPQSL